MAGPWNAVALASVFTLACGAGTPAAPAQAVVADARLPPGSRPRVLLVGSHRGKPGGFATIQAAVDAARPGDWILVGEGDYHERGAPKAGVLITTPGIHLRGMDRDRVIVDGTRDGFGPCSADPAAQDLGPGGDGRNGIEILKVDGVSVENLTACNFLGGAAGNDGNQIWWNGGDGSGQIGMGSYRGAHLTASSTWFDAAVPNAAQYGLFVSNARGPGLIEHSYASNMADSSFYVGACPDCNAVLRFLHAQNSALGYSGTNAGGHLVIEDSEWDLNRSGILPSSLANDDPPSPQDGACPDAPDRSCTLIQRNYIHHNNNPDTPVFGLTAGAPIGTGIDLSGGRNNTIRGNLLLGNGSWGILINDYPDASMPGVPAWCQGGTPFFAPPPPFDQILGPVIPCYFAATGNQVRGNLFFGNGAFGNPTNADLGNAALGAARGNCFQFNFDLKSGRPSSAPANLQDPSVAGQCGAAWTADPAQVGPLFMDVICAAYGPGSGACLPGPGYPQPTSVRLLPIPPQPGLADPCRGVPPNGWCTGR
jgi:hypothetical protein